MDLEDHKWPQAVPGQKGTIFPFKRIDADFAIPHWESRTASETTSPLGTLQHVC